jgi:GNAT superfamily N-acetyltransferase
LWVEPPDVIITAKLRYEMNVVVYRRAALEDVPAMAELRSTSGWEGGAGAETMRRYLAGQHHPQQALAARAAFLAEVDGTLAGFIAGHLTKRFGCDGELQWLLVAPAWRGSPAAGGLLQELARWFATQRAARICVNVASDNERARHFYSRHGATDLAPHWMEWPDIGRLSRTKADYETEG